ncbi:hypothetical protein D3C84_1260370 [compost metagenome]
MHDVNDGWQILKLREGSRLPVRFLEEQLLHVLIRRYERRQRIDLPENAFQSSASLNRGLLNVLLRVVL